MSERTQYRGSGQKARIDEVMEKLRAALGTRLEKFQQTGRQQQQQNLSLNELLTALTHLQHSTDLETLLKTSDLALYEAKEGGRNNYVIFRPDMLERDVLRVEE